MGTESYVVRKFRRFEAVNRFAGVAQISNLLYRRASSLRDVRIIQRAGRFAGLPIGNRRYSRLESALRGSWRGGPLVPARLQLRNHTHNLIRHLLTDLF